jgi:hypothetical protein
MHCVRDRARGPLREVRRVDVVAPTHQHIIFINRCAYVQSRCYPVF